MRIVFLGTPDFAVPPLESILSSKHEVIAVITQPDRPKGRKGEIAVSPVKACAEAHSIAVYQYSKIRAEGVDDVKRLAPDIMVTCAFGQILSQELIDIPKHGIINIHASLLPKYRGAAPIQQSIIDGERESGVTIMKTEAGIDTGDIILQRKTAIDDCDNAQTLFDKLSALGAEMIVEALDEIERGTARYTPQDASKATYVKMLKKEDGKIDWSKTPRQIFDFVRGLNPWPCAFTSLCGQTLKVWKVRTATDGECANIEKCRKCGGVIVADARSGLFVECTGGAVEICELQAENGKRMSAKNYLLGHKIALGIVLGGE